MGTLLNRRRYMGGGSSLPYDAEIEYLQSVTGAKIVTDIYFDTTTKYTSTFGFGTISRRLLFTGIFGDNRDGYWGIRPDGYVEVNGIDASNVNAANGTHVFVRAYVDDIKTVDGTAINKNWGAREGWFERPTYPLCIFTYQYNAAVNCPDVKFYSATIEKNGVVTNQLIPVRIGTTGYIYDKVTGKLYGNAGTGDFILGNDKTT